MSRDSAGNYSLPSGNPVVTDTPISSNGWGNPTMSDLGNEITNSLDRQGRGGMLAPFRFVDGTISVPGMSWTNEPTMGVYRAGSADMRVTISGVDKGRWVSAGLQDLRDAEWHRLASEKNFSADDDSDGKLVSGDATEVRLFVGGVQAFVVSDALADLDSLADVETRTQVRNSIGGIDFGVAPTTGDGFIRQRTALGAVEDDWIIFLRDAGLQFNYNNVKRLTVDSLGATLTAIGETTFDIVAAGAGADPLVSLRGDTNGGGRLVWDESASTMLLQQTSALGALEDVWVSMAKDGGVELHNNGVNTLETIAEGAQANGTALQLVGSSGASAQIKAWQTEGGFQLRADAGQLQIEQTDNAGVAGDAWIICTTDGAVDLRHNDLQRLVTTSLGVNALGGLLSAVNESAGASSIIGRNDEGGFALRADGDFFELWQTDATGALEARWIKALNLGEISLYAGGTDELKVQDSNANYKTSGAAVKDHGQIYRDVGWNVMPGYPFGSSISLSEIHVGALVHKNSGGAITITLPSGTSGAIAPVGGNTMVQNFDSQDITLDAEGTLYWFNGAGLPTAQPSGQITLGAGGVCTVYHFSDTVWHVWGNGLS